ncbi:transmembrane and ubiquitin-like domain-containing protein 1 isoform X2 [Choristoneura fumiferana]
MPLIEGVGDEVIQFVAALVVVAVGALAWWSTNARPDRYRTVLVMRSRAHHPLTVSIRPRPAVITNTVTSVSTQASTSESNGTSEETHRETSRVIPLQEMDSIVDADMAMMDNNRLHFYRRIDSPHSSLLPASSGEEPETGERPGAAQMQEMDSIVSAMEADVATGCDVFARSTESNAASGTEDKSAKDGDNKVDVIDTAESENASASGAEGNDTTRKILIKLKYLNDTLKEVEGSLDELLKDFKWRHFSVELSAESRVRLIFNGRVLGDERATLRACGLHDRAVVHCLVHPKRAAPAQQRVGGEEPAAATHELVSAGAPAERAWDLENILMTLVSVALTVVWFCRCEYSNMFTASASVALFGLTVFYSVAIFGLYLSDTFHFERRPAQPVPNN